MKKRALKKEAGKKMAKAKSHANLPRDRDRNYDRGLALFKERERVKFLETENKNLREKFAALKRAQMPMTRVVRENTRFAKPKKRSSDLPPRSSDLPTISAAQEQRIVELTRELATMKKNIDIVNSKCTDDIKDLTDTIAKNKENQDQMSDDIAVLVQKVRNYQMREENHKREVTALKKRLEEVEELAPESDSAMQMKMMEGIRAKLLEELYELKKRSNELQSNFKEQRAEMQMKWDEREEYFRKEWNQREREFSEHLQQVKSTSVHTGRRRAHRKTVTSPFDQPADLATQYDDVDMSFDMTKLFGARPNTR